MTTPEEATEELAAATRPTGLPISNFDWAGFDERLTTLNRALEMLRRMGAPPLAIATFVGHWADAYATEPTGAKGRGGMSARHMVNILDDLCGEIYRDRRTVLAKEAFSVARRLESEHAEAIALLRRHATQLARLPSDGDKALIAAAPEMLLWLRRCVNTWGVPLDQSVGDKGDQAIQLGVPFTGAEHAELSDLLTRIVGKATP